MQSSRIRRMFLDYFVTHGHREVPSSSLVPADDPTLLFTNSGMVQFKRTFLGQEQREYTRATTVQRCVRAGGKHNDLEQVGLTRRHHTFFEMLGNFSFGDYFKKEAIAYAWEFLTSSKYLGLHPDRLHVSVHHTDDQARALWREIARLPDSRIYGLGDKDNFWQMADTGPCGFNSEIYVDLSWRPGNPPAALSVPEFEQLSEEGRFLEIWNLVFMQFDRSADGTLTPLPKPSVDTGAGLERIAAVMQGEDDNFHTDLFLPLLAAIESRIGKKYGRSAKGDDVSFRVIADHARAVTFLITDGVYPGNEGRDYVLRRILRRAVRHAWLLGHRKPILAHLSEIVIHQMKDTYPGILLNKSIYNIIFREENQFLSTIEGGLQRLDGIFKSGKKVIEGRDAFMLYDTFGFPIDLTQLIAEEKGVHVDITGFEEALEEQRNRSRAARGIDIKGEMRGSGKAELKVNVAKAESEWKSLRKDPQIFVGYDATQSDTDILAFRQSGDRVDLILKENPFYVESGGQVSDVGEVSGQGWSLQIDHVKKSPEGVLISGVFSDPFEPTPVAARVDSPRRRSIERNHSATHLVHAALRKILGSHVRQQGSLVEPDRLRFDFSHHGPIDPGMLQQIEHDVNEQIFGNAPVDTREMPYPEAIKLGAMAFFSEKYGDVVRVVRMGDSIELCGGTHVRSTGQIGLFRFSGQGGVAAGVRRIEAVTGEGAYRSIVEQQERLRQVAELLRSQPDQVLRRAEQLMQEKTRLEGRLAEALKGGGGAADPGETLDVGGVSVTLSDTALENRDEVAATADRFRQGRVKAVLVLFNAEGRGAIHVAVTDDLVKSGKKAGDLAGRIAALGGGKGGGRPQFASAGVGDVSRMPEIKSAVPRLVSDWLNGGG
ncbi:MAG: alanine--tRNA ligase [Gemmatimonadota bacterium]